MMFDKDSFTDTYSDLSFREKRTKRVLDDLSDRDIELGLRRAAERVGPFKFPDGVEFCK